MKLKRILESLTESVDGAGNPHWKRDLVVIASAIAAMVLVMVYAYFKIGV